MTKDEIILVQQARIEQLLEAVEYCCSQVQEFITVPGISKALSTPDDLSALRAHDEKLLTLYQWQPIETAPKGGRFLTCTKLSDGSFGQVGISHSFFCHSVNARDWRIAGDDPRATHWMPLPSAEAIEKGGV